jgi:virginiamycin B lyase
MTTSGAVTEYPVPTPSSGPAFIAAGPDGNMWFTETSAAKIAKIVP